MDELMTTLCVLLTSEEATSAGIIGINPTGYAIDIDYKDGNSYHLSLDEN